MAVWLAGFHCAAGILTAESGSRRPDAPDSGHLSISIVLFYYKINNDSIFRDVILGESGKSFDSIIISGVKIRFRTVRRKMSGDKGHRLLMLAKVWDELAARHSRQSFEKRFFPDLERLENFRKDFAGDCPDGGVRALERKIIQAIKEEFPRDEVHRLRARLNRSN